jgi:hypothetical protein
MVMMLTVWVVVNDVEVSSCKGRLAGLADEAMLVVTTSQTTIRGLDRFALNRLTATSADMLRRSTGSLRRRRSGREAVLGRRRCHGCRCGRRGALRTPREEARDNR